MAHFTYEYSANLSDAHLDLPGLMEKVHAAAEHSGVFPVAGIRSRAIKCEHFRVADGDPAKGFINLSVKIGRGRAASVRMQLGTLLWETMQEHLKPLLETQPVTLSFEMRELEEQVKFNHRNF